MWSQHRWWTVGLLALLMVLAAGGTCWAVFFRTVASPVSLRAALRIYRRDHVGGPTSTAAPSGPAVLTPGVYPYATSGSEGLNLMGVSRFFPARTAMVVTSGPGRSCSTVDWVPLVQHTESTTVCRSVDHSLAVSALTEYETIGGSTTTTVVTCPSSTYFIPPIDLPGVHWTALCHQVSPAENVTVSGQVVGLAPMDVGGTTVSALHVRLTFTFAGVDQGTSPADFWISTARGLVVRERETAHITQDGVHYTELMDSRLTSVTPAG